MKKAKPKQLPGQAFVNAVDQHEQATIGRSPQRTRNAFLAQPVIVDGVSIYPVNLSIQILLEDLDHPILKSARAATPEEAAKIQFSARDLLRLIFIFSDPEEAYRSFGMSRENFEASARDFGFSLPPGVTTKVLPAIMDSIRKTNQSIPGVADTSTEGQAADPLVTSPAQTPG
jgi:hypothetical protein